MKRRLLLTFQLSKVYSNALDVAKAYTYCMQLINAVPVCGYLDRYELYDHHVIEDLTMYCVECEATTIATSILFPTVYSRCFGYQLKKAILHNIAFSIMYFRRPGEIEKVNYRSPIDTLFNNSKISKVRELVNRM